MAGPRVSDHSPVLGRGSHVLDVAAGVSFTLAAAPTHGSEHGQHSVTASDQVVTDGGGGTPSTPSPPAPSSRPSSPPPRYPEYSSLQSRLDSFVGWPQRVVGVSPASLAACGFFYIGSADRVRCFQCGVTLRNWEPKDDPATEHLTWSPACPVALLPPGPDSQTGFTDVQAPPQSVGESNAVGGAGSSGIESVSRNFEQLGVNIPGSGSRGEAGTTQTGAAQSWEPTTRVHGNTATAAGQEPPSVLAVLELGYSRDVVDRVRERMRRLQGTDFPDAVSLLTAVMEEDSSGQANQPQTPLSVETTSASTSSAVSTLKPSVTNGNESSHSSPDDASIPSTSGATHGRGRQPRFRQCKLCEQREVTVTFLPCGHLISCSDCAEKCQACPRCGKNILGTVRTYFA